MDILIGTKNKYKATEMVALLGKFPDLRIHFLDESNINIKIEEDQKTLKKNAEKKATEISKLTGYYVLASDGGVDIQGLGKKWDILRNQRTVGEDKTGLEKADKLLNLMRGLKKEKRKAIYYLSLALAKNGILIWSTEKVYDKGYIAEELPDRNISQGLWMGHLWYYPQYKKVFNKLSEEEKQVVRKQGEGIKKDLQLKIRKILYSTKDHF
jgi:inosine/xanthosine triphosphate pyrophosphatase family protein